MRGLLLTNYYLVYRTFFMFMGIAILGAGCVFYFGNASMYRLIATFIIFLLQFLHLKLLNMRVSQVMKICTYFTGY